MPDTQTRLLAKLIREELAGQTFEHVADLVDALKWRCSRLRIRCTNDDISEALWLIESNRPLVRYQVNP